MKWASISMCPGYFLFLPFMQDDGNILFDLALQFSFKPALNDNTQIFLLLH